MERLLVADAACPLGVVEESKRATNERREQPTSRGAASTAPATATDFVVDAPSMGGQALSYGTQPARWWWWWSSPLFQFLLGTASQLSRPLLAALRRDISTTGTLSQTMMQPMIQTAKLAKPARQLVLLWIRQQAPSSKGGFAESHRPPARDGWVHPNGASHD